MREQSTPKASSITAPMSPIELDVREEGGPMASIKELRSRWKREPGLSIYQRVCNFCDGLGKDHARAASDLFRLLEGLPYRNEVENGRDFRGSDMSAQDLDLNFCDFSFSRPLGPFLNCDLTGSIFDSISTERMSIGSIVKGASFRKAAMRGCYIVGADARSCCFDEGKLDGISFERTDLSGSTFRRARCTRGTFLGADLRNCDFTGAVLNESVFQDAILDKSTCFRGASLINAYYDDVVNRDGLLVARGVDLLRATYDDTTRLGNDDAVIALKLLEKASKVVMTMSGKDAAMVREIIEESMVQVKSGYSEGWEDLALAKLDESGKALFQDVLEEAEKRA